MKRSFETMSGERKSRTRNEQRMATTRMIITRWIKLVVIVVLVMMVMMVAMTAMEVGQAMSVVMTTYKAVIPIMRGRERKRSREERRRSSSI